jgi:hypothetical protein
VRIYISSTYEDLKEERRAVRDAIHDLQHEPVGMETYEAADQIPLDRCLEDVRSCQAYVGIFAWKYGFFPNGGAISITELEYREAEKNNIPRYIYLLGDNVPWPPNLIPKQDRDRIEVLRNRLKLDRLVSFFASPAELARAVTQSLSRHLPVNDRRPVPPILPYLCDRSAQEDRLADLIVEAANRPARPVVCIIHGDETEAHDKFFERLRDVTFPSLLSIQQTGMKPYHLDWPAERLTPDELKRRLLRSLSRVVVNSPTADRDLLANVLSQNPGPVAIHAHILTETWEQQRSGSLDSFLQFWNEWPELGVGTRLFALLFIKYQLNTKKFRALKKEICETVGRLDVSRYSEMTVAVLPELIAASRQDAENWARSSQVTQFCDAERLVSAVGKFYEYWAATKNARGTVRIPTEELAPKLYEMMSRVQCAIGVPA